MPRKGYVGAYRVRYTRQPGRAARVTRATRPTGRVGRTPKKAPGPEAQVIKNAMLKEVQDYFKRGNPSEKAALKRKLLQMAQLYFKRK